MRMLLIKLSLSPKNLLFDLFVCLFVFLSPMRMLLIKLSLSPKNLLFELFYVCLFVCLLHRSCLFVFSYL